MRKKTTFLQSTDHIDLEEFKSYYENHSNTQCVQKYNISKARLLKYLSNNNIKLHSKSENTTFTNLERYGCTNVMSSQQVKAKVIERYGGSSPFCLKEVRDKRDRTVKEKYGVDNVFQIPAFIEWNKQNQINTYGGVGWLSSYQQHLYNRYKYDEKYFDSSWELALWIYAKDHDESIVREPIRLLYKFEDKDHIYIPDFKYKGELIEIKGDHFFRGGKMICPYDRNLDELFNAKYQCMLANNIKIMRYNDIKFALNYCKEKYNKVNWKKDFKIIDSGSN